MPRLDQVERVLRIAFYMKFLFGTPRKSMIALLVIAAVVFVGFLAFRVAFDSERALLDADRTYDNDRIAGVAEYKILLEKRDFFDRQRFWIEAGREKMYRRIISFESRYGARDEARDYALSALKEGINNLSFEYEDARRLWDEVTGKVKPETPDNSGTPNTVPAAEVNNGAVLQE